MPRKLAQTLNQGNDEPLLGTVIDEDGGLPEDLSGVTLNMYIKPTRQTADTDGSVTKLSTSTGEITIVSAPAGTYRVEVPDSVLSVAGLRWYRVDAVSGTDVRTVVYGPLRVRDL